MGSKNHWKKKTNRKNKPKVFLNKQDYFLFHAIMTGLLLFIV